VAAATAAEKAHFDRSRENKVLLMYSLTPPPHMEIVKAHPCPLLLHWV
jgi:hypothetical protein